VLGVVLAGADVLVLAVVVEVAEVTEVLEDTDVTEVVEVVDVEVDELDVVAVVLVVVLVAVLYIIELIFAITHARATHEVAVDADAELGIGIDTMGPVDENGINHWQSASW
jgi:hypothetical protein